MIFKGNILSVGYVQAQYCGPGGQKKSTGGKREFPALALEIEEGEKSKKIYFWFSKNVDLKKMENANCCFCRKFGSKTCRWSTKISSS